MHTVLIVEDDLAIADLLQELLQDEGYAVVHAQDGKEALELLAQRPCNLVLADLMMPRMDGRELRGALAAHPAYSSLPVVLMTAASNLVVHDLENFTAVLSKPFDLEAVLGLIGGLLDETPTS